MRNIIKAKEGRVLTNGTDYATIVYLAEGADAEEYHEITIEEYRKIMEEKTNDEDIL